MAATEFIIRQHVPERDITGRFSTLVSHFKLAGEKVGRARTVYDADDDVLSARVDRRLCAQRVKNLITTSGQKRSHHHAGT